MTETLHHEIAVLLASGRFTNYEIECMFGVDLIEACLEQIERYASFLRAELEFMSAGRTANGSRSSLSPWPDMTPEERVRVCQDSSGVVLFFLYASWYVPPTAEHMRYLQWRSAKADRLDYADELGAMAAALEASDAIEAALQQAASPGRAHD